GIIYQLSGFFVISVVFPMIIAAAVWLPLILLMVEFMIQQKPAFRGRPSSVPWLVIGAVALGCNILAGHVEITYYTLIITAYYAAARLVWEWWRGRHPHPLTPSPLRREGEKDTTFVLKRGVWLLLMVVLGVGVGAIQFLPLLEAAGTNFRSGSVTF